MGWLRGFPKLNVCVCVEGRGDCWLFLSARVYVCFYLSSFESSRRELGVHYERLCWYRTEEIFYETFVLAGAACCPQGGLFLHSAFFVRLASVHKESGQGEAGDHYY